MEQHSKLLSFLHIVKLIYALVNMQILSLRKNLYEVFHAINQFSHCFTLTHISLVRIGSKQTGTGDTINQVI